MKQWGSIVLACSLAFTGFSSTAVAQQTTVTAITPVTTSATVAPVSVPTSSVMMLNTPPLIAIPEIKANAYLLLDTSSGQVLAQHDANTLVEPASLTKLMTAYLVFEALKNHHLSLEQQLLVSKRARNMEGSRMFIEEGAQVKVEDLIKGMIVQSGNDATVTLAEGVGGSVENFVAMMNAKAQQLGMVNTSFKNPEGLPAEGHMTTAQDMAILSMHLINDYPQEYKYYSIKQFEYQPKPNVAPIKQDNRNRLLFLDPTVDGLKTGHTKSAGYCLVSSAVRPFPNLSEKRRLLSVLLGATSETSRSTESQKLLNWGFQAWDSIQLFNANQVIVTPKVWKGEVNEVKVGFTKPIVITVPHGQENNVQVNALFNEPLTAPLTKGQTIGDLTIVLNTAAGPVSFPTQKLVVLEEVPEAGFFGRTWDAMRLWFQ